MSPRPSGRPQPPSGPPRPAPPGSRPGDVRRALLDATLRIVAEKGPIAVSLREVARAAGVSQTAPYRHFADRADMLAAAAEEGARVLRANLVTASEGLDPFTALVHQGLAYVAFARRHPAYFRLLYGHGAPHKSVTPGLQSAARDVFQLIHATMARAQAARLIRPGSTVALVFHLWSCAHGVAALAVEGQLAFLAAGDQSLADVPVAARMVIETHLTALRTGKGRG